MLRVLLFVSEVPVPEAVDVYVAQIAPLNCAHFLAILLDFAGEEVLLFQEGASILDHR